MMKKVYWVGLILALVLILTTFRSEWQDESEIQGGRYHPNGTEPVYVGVFGG